MNDENENLTETAAPRAKPVVGVSRSRKMASGLNAAVALVFVAMITVLVNYLAFRHYRTLDWTREGYYELSDQTKSLLASLESPLEVVVMFSSNEGNVQEYVQTLLGEYAAHSKQVQVEFIDPMFGNRARVEQLKKEFKLNQSETNVVIFKYRERSKYLRHSPFGSDLVDMDMSEVQFGGRPRVVNYKAEEAFTSAITNVTEEKQVKMYFLQGHGERSPDDPTPRRGLSEVKSALVRQNLLVETLNLAKTGKIPEDCAALAIIGPTVAFSAPEVKLIGDYLDNKGRVLLFLDPSAANLAETYGLGELLGKWNVRLGSDVVTEPQFVQIGDQVGILGSPLEIYCENYSAHPITASLKGLPTLFPITRSVHPLNATEGADRPRVTPLIKTSPDAYGETSVTDHTKGKLKPDEGVDSKGPLPIAVAVESGGAVAGAAIGSTRLVVVGNSLCVTNNSERQANVSFALNAVNWLLERHKLIGIPPKPTRSYTIEMTPRQLKFTVLGSILGLPALAAFCGVLVWWRRRH